MHVTFQGLDGEYFYSILMEFRLYIWKKNYDFTESSL